MSTRGRRFWSPGVRVREAGNITQLLQQAASGDTGARDTLYDRIYHELRAIARAHRRRWEGNHTLNTTALIHETYLKLAKVDTSDFRNRTHFFATASQAMRQVLINYAKRYSSAKRGGEMLRVTLSEHLPNTEDSLDDLLHIEKLLEQLEAKNERQCRLFECRIFGGMTIEETAAALDISPATVKRDWQLISAWVYRELNDQLVDS